MKSPSELSTLLPTLFTGKPLEKRFRESIIWRVWDKAVGQPIASKARPAAFREGTLIVAVTSPPWMQQLGFLKRQLMDAVNGALGEEMITDIHLKAGILPPPYFPPPPPPRRPTRPLTPEEENRIREETAAVHDEELRAAIIHCREVWLSSRS